MTPKWTIRKYDRDSYPWKVFAPGVDAPSSPGLATYASRFGGSSYESALRYANDQIAKADRKARTVEVELPKVEDWKVLPSKRQRVDQLAWGAIIRDTTSDYEDSGGYVYIDDSDLKPLALHLLALHYEMENQ